VTEPTKTVVVVDDDQAFRRSMELFLESAGYRPRTFASASAFLASRPEEGPTCVLVDLRMPGMSGLELQAALERNGRRCAVVFLSGHGDVKATASAMKRGAVDFIEKPYQEASLIDAIERAIEKDRRLRAAWADRLDAERRLARLTPAERTVCDLLAQGHRTKEIAASLGKAESTIKMQRWNAMSKLRVSTPMEIGRLLERAAADASVDKR
jgi:FixJ family two-component response regulator